MSLLSMFTRNRSTAVLMLMIVLCAFAGPAAAEGLSQVNEFLQSVIGILKGAGILIVTLAIMWAGYKILWGGASFREISPIFIGALFIGGAATIASYLIPA